MMNNENGRSMVEMLGVLAIIGVLSVAGIAGYTIAMQKYRANEIVNTASQLAILTRALNMGNGGKLYAGAAPSGAEAGEYADSGLPGAGGATLSAVCDNNGCKVTIAGGDATVNAKAIDMAGGAGNTAYTLS